MNSAACHFAVIDPMSANVRPLIEQPFLCLDICYVEHPNKVQKGST